MVRASYSANKIVDSINVSNEFIISDDRAVEIVLNMDASPIVIREGINHTEIIIWDSLFKI